MTENSPLARLAGSAVLITLVTLVARSASFGREIMTASAFGIGHTLDAFLVAFLVPSFFIFAIAGCAGPALIPVVMAARHNGGRAAVHSAIARINGSSLVVFGGISALIIILAQFYLPLLDAHMDPGQSEIVWRWVVLLSLLIPVYGYAALWTAIANSHGFAAIPAAVPAITPLLTMIMLFALAGRGDAWALVIGVMLGGMLELTAIGLLLHRRGLLSWPIISFGQFGNFERAFATLFASAATLGLIPLADQAMAALAGPGGIARIAFGARLGSLLGSIAALGLGYAALPVFSRLVAEENWADLKSLITRSVLLTLALAIPLCLMLAWYSPAIVELMFQRGNFHASETVPVAEIQAVYVLQIPFFMGWILLSSVMAAMQRKFSLLAMSAIAAVLNAALNWLLLPGFGVLGIAWATTITIFVLFIMVSGVTYRNLNRKADQMYFPKQQGRGK